MIIDDLLNQSDADLFQHGACHVFADELLKSFPDIGLQLKWTVKSRSFIGDSHYGCHVYCVDKSGIYKIDVMGIEVEDDFLKKENENVDGFTCESFFVDRERLFLFNEFESSDGIKRTSERLLVDDVFLSRARARAREVIRRTASCFKIP